MAPKAVVYHICGQHLSGQAVVGYVVGPDTPIMLGPKLVLRGGAVVQRRPALSAPTLVLRGGTTAPAVWNPHTMGAPTLVLRGGATAFSISTTLSLGIPRLFLIGGPHIVGKEKALVPTTPESFPLHPTIEEDWLLVPTTEVEM